MTTHEWAIVFSAASGLLVGWITGKLVYDFPPDRRRNCRGYWK